MQTSNVASAMCKESSSRSIPRMKNPLCSCRYRKASPHLVGEEDLRDVPGEWAWPPTSTSGWLEMAFFADAGSGTAGQYHRFLMRTPCTHHACVPGSLTCCLMSQLKEFLILRTWALSAPRIHAHLHDP